MTSFFTKMYLYVRVQFTKIMLIVQKENTITDEDYD